MACNSKAERKSRLYTEVDNEKWVPGSPQWQAKLNAGRNVRSSFTGEIRLELKKGFKASALKPLILLVPGPGFEPGTLGFSVPGNLQELPDINSIKSLGYMLFLRRVPFHIFM